VNADEDAVTIRSLSILLALCCTIHSLRAETLVYEIRPAANSRMEVTVEKTGLLSGRKHLFVFSRFNGILSSDPADPTSSDIAIAIDANSIECHDTWLGAKDLRKVLEYAIRRCLPWTCFRGFPSDPQKLAAWVEVASVSKGC
jgi:hypothetical protein